MYNEVKEKFGAMHKKYTPPARVEKCHSAPWTGNVDLPPGAPKQGWQPIATCPLEVRVIFGWSEQKDAGCGKRSYDGHFIDNVRRDRYDVQPDRWMPIPEWD
jgi:hypothetical protein